MLPKWLPWKFLIRRAARRHNILDPATVLARLRKFAQPSEVDLPLEILRAWVIFQARGVINTRAIQHNLDWVWPYWIERQFNPSDPSFVPRAYSLTHINMTQRNWTAVGLPDLPLYPVIDPRGLVTPLENGWSLDTWILDSQGTDLLPSRAKDARQTQHTDEHLTVTTRVGTDGSAFSQSVRMVADDQGEPVLEITVDAEAQRETELAFVLRPYNPEGVQFIDRVAPRHAGPGWLVNPRDKTGAEIIFSEEPQRYSASNYEEGDVYRVQRRQPSTLSHDCDVGMVTAAALFPLVPNEPKRITARIPLAEEKERVLKNAPKIFREESRRTLPSWKPAIERSAQLAVPDPGIMNVFTSCRDTLLLLSPGDIFPGPAVYKRFWFRDSAMIMNALLGLGHSDRVLRTLRSLPERQKHDGFFESQEGEWDSNGEILWAVRRYTTLTGEKLPDDLMESMHKAAEWILRKRLPINDGDPHGGMLPAGFSAEHLGPNDYYFWDNFWGIAGLLAYADELQERGRTEDAARFRSEAENYQKRIWEIIEAIPERRAQGGIPAAPRRRLDAGAIGSIVADYPARLVEPGHPRLMATVEFLLKNCFYEKGFFQDMTHSGINVYLTLQIAQILLRNGDDRYRELIADAVKRASPTGHWPEAVHPFSGGGCMGDGQHAWAATDFVMMIRSLFLREEDDGLVLGSGLYPEWLEQDEPLLFGPTPTPWGPVTVRIEGPAGAKKLSFEADWRTTPPRIEARLPGQPPKSIEAAQLSSAGPVVTV